MGAWFPRPALRLGESPLTRAWANLFRGRREVGARIIVTDQRLLVTPNRLDALFRARPISIERAHITDVRVVPAGAPTPQKRGLSARLRPTIEVATASDEVAFVVRDTTSLVRELQA